MESIRCEDCGNADPARFRRIYVEASRERLVDGEWTVEEAWEYADGSETYTECVACGSIAVDERYADAEDLAAPPEAVERVLIDSYKEHLCHEASLRFSYDDDDDGEQFWRGEVYRARVQGALAVAKATGMKMTRDAVVGAAVAELAPDLRSALPALRERAARPFRETPLHRLTDDDRAHNRDVASARRRLEKAEAALDALLEGPQDAPWWPEDDPPREPYDA
jgi:hypothetical protein